VPTGLRAHPPPGPPPLRRRRAPFINSFSASLVTPTSDRHLRCFFVAQWKYIYTNISMHLTKLTKYYLHLCENVDDNPFQTSEGNGSKLVSVTRALPLQWTSFCFFCSFVFFSTPTSDTVFASLLHNGNIMINTNFNMHLTKYCVDLYGNVYDNPFQSSEGNGSKVVLLTRQRTSSTVFSLPFQLSPPHFRCFSVAQLKYNDKYKSPSYHKARNLVCIWKSNH
jgi:hypothetical protein